MMSGGRHRRKGVRIEREFVQRHEALGLHAERYPLSGSSRFRESGHDLDLYLFGRATTPIRCEVKGRKSGTGFAMLEKWLADFDALFLRRNNGDPLVCIPWKMWERIIQRLKS
jgi:hypothetical protein